MFSGESRGWGVDEGVLVTGWVDAREDHEYGEGDGEYEGGEGGGEGEGRE